jgi:hypothetical protein
MTETLTYWQPVMVAPLELPIRSDGDTDFLGT